MIEKKLHNALRKTARAVHWSELARAGGVLIAAVLLILLTAVAIDVALSLPSWGLWLVDICLVSMVACGLGWLYWVSYRNRYDSRKIARRIESQLDIPSSSLINAVDLLNQSENSMSNSLRQAAITQGISVAATVNHREMIDMQKLRRAILAAFIATGITVAAFITLPGVFKAVLPRLLSPNASLPSFTLVQFEVNISPAKVYQGKQATIDVTLTSGAALPNQANIVFVDDDNSPISSMPMIRKETGKFQLQIGQATQTRRFFIKTPSGRSGYFTLEVHSLPEISRVHIRQKFPDYTNWPASNAVLRGDNRIRVIKGTQIEMTVEANVPIKRGSLVLTPNDQQPPLQIKLLPTSDPKKFKASWNLQFSGHYKLSIFNEDDITPAQPFRGSVTCVKDQHPQINITSPAAVLVAPVNWKVKVDIEARDDVGIDEITFLRSINGWGPTPVKMEVNPPRTPFAKVNALFDLEKLGARPGDIISYYASARDVYPDMTQFRDTPAYVIRVISMEDYTAQLRQKYRMERILAELEEFHRLKEKVDDLRNELKKKVEELEKKIKAQNGKWTKEDFEKLEEIAKLQKEYRDSMQKLAKNLRDRSKQPDVWELDDEYKKTLNELADSLDNQASGSDLLQQIHKQIKGSSSVASKYIKDTKDQLNRDAADIKKPAEAVEQIKKEVEHLAEADKMIELMEQLNAIVKQQRDVADRLAQFRNKETLDPADQIRAKQLAQEQHLIKVELETTLKQMVDVATAAREILPKMSQSVIKIVEAIDELEVKLDQENASKLAQAGQGRYAHMSAESAAVKLESLYKENFGDNGENIDQMIGSDLDQALQLTRQSLKQMLGQLRGSRGISAQGRGQGRGRGQGAGAGGGYGSKSRMRLVGPLSGGAGNSNDGSNAGGSGTGMGDGSRKFNQHGEAENINAGTDVNRGQNLHGTQSGTPVRYKGLVDAYFRRLADESK